MDAISLDRLIVTKVNAGESTDTEDVLAVEEPLEIRLIYGPKNDRIQKSISVTMRTPGNDKELAIGFLFTEGIIQHIDQIDQSFSFSCNEMKENTINIALKSDIAVDLGKLDRHFYTTSSCGVCGKSSIESIKITIEQKFNNSELKISSKILFQLPTLLSQHQSVFKSTGGLHASAFFTTDGELLAVREDVGRHNALDKLIGKSLLDNEIPANNKILILSGRASFELIQKAAAAGVQIVAAVGAPSSLAVSLAKEFGITLIGFLRGEKFNIYCGRERVIN